MKKSLGKSLEPGVSVALKNPDIATLVIAPVCYWFMHFVRQIEIEIGKMISDWSVIQCSYEVKSSCV